MKLLFEIIFYLLQQALSSLYDTGEMNIKCNSLNYPCVN